MSEEVKQETTWPFLRFGLLVTGDAEYKHAAKLFRSLTATGTCYFEVIRQVEQRSPRTSGNRWPITGTDTPIPTKDEEEISLPTKGYLRRSPQHFIILLDDLEYDRQPIAQQVYERYRRALDKALEVDARRRASVHLLVMMLEAYYFGDPDAVNTVLDLNPPLVAHQGDVEQIRNPKASLKRLYPGLSEIDDGGKILALLDVKQVLVNPTTCAWLRVLFAWCVKILERHPQWQAVNPGDLFHLADGIMSYVTGPQTGTV